MLCLTNNHFDVLETKDIVSKFGYSKVSWRVNKKIQSLRNKSMVDIICKCITNH